MSYCILVQVPPDIEGVSVFWSIPIAYPPNSNVFRNLLYLNPKV
jgi:hypothetical protein